MSGNKSEITHVIDFDNIESKIDRCRANWQDGQPFPSFVIDDFCNAKSALIIAAEFPDPTESSIGKSRDYVFAKNKYEKSSLGDVSATFAGLKRDLCSPRFSSFLEKVTGTKSFLDPEFHGGGIHIGGEGAFLDMHVDFNYHPIHDSWRRYLNILIYFNQGWKKEFGGELKLRKLDSDLVAEIEPLFNRAVVMLTDSTTLHGYDPIAFPTGEYRKSIAGYSYYEELDRLEPSRSTRWYPRQRFSYRRPLGYFWPSIIRTKNRFFGSRTAKNK